MKTSDIIKSSIATLIAGISIYGLKKREERLFKKEYNQLQEKYKAEFKELSQSIDEA